MQAMIAAGHKGGLEGLCERATSKSLGMRARIQVGPGCEGIERLEAHFLGQAFAPHRHDTYAIGITLAGVQTFRYRGEQRHSLPGQCHILHPDEMHDGTSGTNDGFAYRIIYVDPSLVQAALGGKPLPFVSTPVIELSGDRFDFVSLVWDMEGEIDGVRRAEIATAVADFLLAYSGGAMPSTPLRLHALRRVRALIAADPDKRHAIDDLERAAGLDRWSLARQFRAAFGTSPSRFRTLRRLDEVRRSIRRGAGLAEAAVDAGFADQSHMSRQFKLAYGLTPARWAAALSRSGRPPH
jgi:AraC-like DNA-binding protein